jgi:hypothetical protein
VSSFEEAFFSQNWSFLIKCPGQTFHQNLSKIIFFLSSFIGRVKQAQTINFWTSIFEKIVKIMKNFDFFGLFPTFEAEARPSAVKILQV